MDKLRVKETLTLPSGKVFLEGNEYYGRFKYYFGTDLIKKDHTMSNLVVIYDIDQTWLVNKDHFECI